MSSFTWDGDFISCNFWRPFAEGKQRQLDQIVGMRSLSEGEGIGTGGKALARSLSAAFSPAKGVWIMVQVNPHHIHITANFNFAYYVAIGSGSSTIAKLIKSSIFERYSNKEISKYFDPNKESNTSVATWSDGGTPPIDYEALCFPPQDKLTLTDERLVLTGYQATQDKKDYVSFSSATQLYETYIGYPKPYVGAHVVFRGTTYIFNGTFVHDARFKDGYLFVAVGRPKEFEFHCFPHKDEQGIVQPAYADALLEGYVSGTSFYTYQIQTDTEDEYPDYGGFIPSIAISPECDEVTILSNRPDNPGGELFASESRQWRYNVVEIVVALGKPAPNSMADVIQGIVPIYHPQGMIFEEKTLTVTPLPTEPIDTEYTADNFYSVWSEAYVVYRVYIKVDAPIHLSITDIDAINDIEATIKDTLYYKEYEEGTGYVYHKLPYTTVNSGETHTIRFDRLTTDSASTTTKINFRVWIAHDTTSAYTGNTITNSYASEIRYFFKWTFIYKKVEATVVDTFNSTGTPCLAAIAYDDDPESPTYNTSYPFYLETGVDNSESEYTRKYFIGYVYGSTNTPSVSFPSRAQYEQTIDSLRIETSFMGEYTKKGKIRNEIVKYIGGQRIPVANFGHTFDLTGVDFKYEYASIYKFVDNSIQRVKLLAHEHSNSNESAPPPNGTFATGYFENLSEGLLTGFSAFTERGYFKRVSKVPKTPQGVENERTGMSFQEVNTFKEYAIRNGELEVIGDYVEELPPVSVEPVEINPNEMPGGYLFPTENTHTASFAGAGLPYVETGRVNRVPLFDIPYNLVTYHPLIWPGELASFGATRNKMWIEDDSGNKVEDIFEIQTTDGIININGSDTAYDILCCGMGQINRK